MNTVRGINIAVKGGKKVKKGSRQSRQNTSQATDNEQLETSPPEPETAQGMLRNCSPPVREFQRACVFLASK